MEGSLVAYKVFTNGSVLNASEINDNLMNQSVMVFSNSTARAAAITAPVEGMLTWLEDVNRYEFRNGSGAWQTLGSGILQVVSTSKTDTFSTNSATFTTVTGLTATITPSSTSSKILVMAQISIGMAPLNNSYGHYKVTRGGTDIHVGDAAGSRIRNVFGGYIQANLNDVLLSNSIIDLDSPSSTSALTYQVEARRGALSTLVYVNRSPGDLDDPNFGRGASSITLMEVAG
jgi:hypothetical protein